MLLMAFLFVLLAFVVAVVLWALSINTDPVLTKEQDNSEAIYVDEKGKSQKFPRLIQGSSVTKAELKLSVVIPAYNERERLPGMLEDAIATLSKLSKKDTSYSWEIIVVDDGSRDKIHEVVAPFVKEVSSEKLRLMHLAVNQGKGGAVRKGALVARGEFIYMADADLAATAAELGKLEIALAKVTKNGYGVAVGSRAAKPKRVFGLILKNLSATSVAALQTLSYDVGSRR